MRSRARNTQRKEARLMAKALRERARFERLNPDFYNFRKLAHAAIRLTWAKEVIEWAYLDILKGGK